MSQKSIFFVSEMDGNLIYSKCAVHPHNPSSQGCNRWSFNQSSEVEECSKYLYDTTTYKSTIVTDWDLVCDQSYQAPLATSTFFAGTLVAAPTFGFLADKFGRRPTLMASLLLMFASGFAWSFARSVVAYAVLEFLVSCFQIGVFQVLLK